MKASDYKIGKRIRNNQTKDILEVAEIDGKLFWESIKWGDTFDWVDEDLYTEIN